jgi:hypothetical protein
MQQHSLVTLGAAGLGQIDADGCFSIYFACGWSFAQRLPVTLASGLPVAGFRPGDPPALLLLCADRDQCCGVKLAKDIELLGSTSAMPM